MRKPPELHTHAFPSPRRSDGVGSDTGTGPAHGGEAAMAGKFELWIDKGGEYRFTLKAANGQVIATSEGYSSKAAALNGIASVKTNAPDAPVVEIEK